MITDKTRINLPRTLVNRLLHVAQLHPSYVRWGIISGHHDNPEHCHQLNGSPLSEIQTRSTLQTTLAHAGEQVWALYCSAPGDIQVPLTSELARFKAPRFLGISLGTQGVLQLMGWQVDGDHLRALEVTIRED